MTKRIEPSRGLVCLTRPAPYTTSSATDIRRTFAVWERFYRLKAYQDARRKPNE